ncbi:hypothetical protein VTN77DRAFT_9722 [Rasamsonia byssochlamydoides]|uniref:uncharacterized protein n=1 Tax=Rasamsonia byssochlamydoides TaxID=89139 RepID=UPI003742275B
MSLFRFHSAFSFHSSPCDTLVIHQPAAVLIDHRAFFFFFFSYHQKTTINSDSGKKETEEQRKKRHGALLFIYIQSKRKERDPGLFAVAVCCCCCSCWIQLILFIQHTVLSIVLQTNKKAKKQFNEAVKKEREVHTAQPAQVESGLIFVHSFAHTLSKERKVCLFVPFQWDHNVINVYTYILHAYKKEGRKVGRGKRKGKKEKKNEWLELHLSMEWTSNGIVYRLVFGLFSTERTGLLSPFFIFFSFRFLLFSSLHLSSKSFLACTLAFSCFFFHFFYFPLSWLHFYALHTEYLCSFF